MTIHETKKDIDRYMLEHHGTAQLTYTRQMVDRELGDKAIEILSDGVPHTMRRNIIVDDDPKQPVVTLTGQLYVDSPYPDSEVQ